jgi:radical SAM superfamily enzyme YgiQ (UPF0313 family)
MTTFPSKLSNIMKLLLINPFDKNTCVFKGQFPPLGLGYIAAATPPECEIEFIDENIEEFVPSKADLVALSVMTIQANRSYEICKMYKKMGIPVVVGGIHVSMLPEEALNFATSVVVGEAESLWPRVIEDFRSGTLKSIYRSDDFPSLNNLVIPRRDFYSQHYKYDTIQTSRGCPFNCDFCSVSVFNGRQFRLRPVDEVVEELKSVKKKLVFFVDDNIIGFGRQNEERAMELFEAIIRSGIKKYWISQASVNVAKNSELLKLMKRSGCQGLLMGFESLDQDKLCIYGKSQNLKRDTPPEKLYKSVIDTLHRHGLSVNGYFCYGYEDTEYSIQSSLKFILKANLDVVNTPIIVPTPGTSLFEKLDHKLEYKNFPQDWSKYLGRLVYCPKSVSKKDFYKAYIASAKKLISLKEILKRSWTTLRHSKNPFHAFIFFLINWNYKKLRQDHLGFMLTDDMDFKLAYEEWKSDAKRGS